MLPVLSFVRSFQWSATRFTVWPSMYREPVFHKNDQNELPEETKKELSFAPFKAAPNSKSTSVFFDPVIERLEACILRKGKRHVAREILGKTFYNIKCEQIAKFQAAKTDEARANIELDPVVITKKAIENMRPCILTKRIKRGGATYQVPHAVSNTSSEFVAIKWLLDSLRDRPKPRTDKMDEVLAKELLLGYKNEGKIVKKKLDAHKLAEANRAYAHYRWG